MCRICPPLLLRTIRHALPWLRHVFVDSTYAANKLQASLGQYWEWMVEIVRRSDTAYL
jgi:hypothetical protein